MCRAHGVEPRRVADACFRGGARWLQLRQKSESRSEIGDPGSGTLLPAFGSGELLTLADDIARMAGRFGAQVIVNDRADICRMAGCAGVHVGQEDLPVDEARRVAGAAAIVGVSTHDCNQIDAALASSATYVAVGPIYGTRTKDTGYGPRGLDLVTYAANRGKPIVAIGGITLNRAPEVLRAGAAAVAVISDVLADGDPEARTRAFLALA